MLYEIVHQHLEWKQCMVGPPQSPDIRTHISIQVRLRILIWYHLREWRHILLPMLHFKFQVCLTSGPSAPNWKPSVWQEKRHLWTEAAGSGWQWDSLEREKHCVNRDRLNRNGNQICSKVWILALKSFALLCCSLRGTFSKTSLGIMAGAVRSAC